MPALSSEWLIFFSAVVPPRSFLALFAEWWNWFALDSFANRDLWDSGRNGLVVVSSMFWGRVLADFWIWSSVAMVLCGLAFLGAGLRWLLVRPVVRVAVVLPGLDIG